MAKSAAMARSALRSCVGTYVVTAVCWRWPGLDDDLRIGDKVTFPARPAWATRYLRKRGVK